jgi:hypothetical protein
MSGDKRKIHTKFLWKKTLRKETLGSSKNRCDNNSGMAFKKWGGRKWTGPMPLRRELL